MVIYYLIGDQICQSTERTVPPGATIITEAEYKVIKLVAEYGANEIRRCIDFAIKKLYS